MRDVDSPPAFIDTGLAEFMSLTGSSVSPTFTVPTVKPVDVAVTIAMPVSRVDLIITVAEPLTAALVVVPISVPLAETLKVITFVALDTFWSLVLHMFVVIRDVLLPSPLICAGDAVLLSLEGTSGAPAE